MLTATGCPLAKGCENLDFAPTSCMGEQAGWLPMAKPQGGLRWTLLGTPGPRTTTSPASSFLLHMGFQFTSFIG
jgi:hypothetical protein